MRRRAGVIAVITLSFLAAVTLPPAAWASATHTRRAAARSHLLFHSGAPADTASAPAKVLPAPQPVLPLPLRYEIDSVASAPAQAGGYAGDVIHPNGSVTVYVTAAGYAEMNAALAALGPNASYKLVTVVHTEAALEDITMSIASAHSLLAQHGITLTTWGPDVSLNKTKAMMLNYTPAKAAWLEETFGGPTLIKVVSANASDVLRRSLPAPAAPAVATAAAGPNRYYDSNPFFGGDRIFIDNNESEPCTAGFTLTGNRSGATYETTAGHCGGSSIYTNFDTRVEMGPVATRYFTDGGYDFETFACGGCTGYVWYEGPSVGTGQGSSYAVVGTCECNSGDVTIDGAGTGQVPDSAVTMANFCDTFSDGIETCHLNRAVNNSHDICYGGDSGGPVYQRGPSGSDEVYATGTIVGSTTNYHTCDYQRIGDLETESDTSISTG